MYENWAVSLLPLKSSLYSHLSSLTWPESKRKNPSCFDAAFLKVVFRVVKKKTLCSVQVCLRKETLQPAQVALNKMPRNEAKIYQETDFLSTDGHLLTSSGCLLTLTCCCIFRLQIMTWQVLRTFCFIVLTEY